MPTRASYQVSLPDFAGPMDLLVFLVRRRELDVSYISVSAIVADYLAWLDRVELSDLDSAGDFVLLAAILLQLKAAGLIPGPEPELAEVEFARHGIELSASQVAALRAGIARLAELEEKQINLFERGAVAYAGVQEELAGEMMGEVSLYEIAVVFRDLIRTLPPDPMHVVEKIPYTIEGQMAFILSFLENRKRIAFSRLMEALERRLAVIMTFLAMLELIRLRRVRVNQPEPFGELWLNRFESSRNVE